MPSFRSDPMWIHFAGLAAVPIFLELCTTAVGDPLPNMVGTIYSRRGGIVPVLWMQLSRPLHLRHFCDRSEARQLTSENSEFN